MTDALPYSVPPEPGRWRALTLAAVMHVALFTFLWFGVRWQNETPATIEAEVWSPLPREAAPQPVAIPEPVPKQEIKPEPKVVPKPVVIEPPVVKPDIALEQEKKRKEKEKERQARDDTARLEKKKADTERIEKEKTEAKTKRDAEDAKTKREAVEAKKQIADKKRQQDALDAKKLANERAEEMRRIAGSGGSGQAAKREGVSGDPGYASKIAAKIKSNTIFNVPDNLTGDPYVQYMLELLPDGSIRHPIRKLKSSGIPGFDEAVLSAIEKSQPFPPDKSGKVPSSVTVIHKPKDQ